MSELIETQLPDLTEVSLADLPQLDREDVEVTVERVLKRAEDPESITSGYNPQRLD